MMNNDKTLRLVRVADGRLLDTLPDGDGSYFDVVTAPLGSWYTENLYEEDCTDVFEALASYTTVGKVAVYRGDDLLFTDDGDALYDTLYDYGVPAVIDRWHEEDEDEETEREENVGDWWYGEV